ncbi:MAG: 4-hydroxy-tetrahydrodipicolinate synthase [Bacteroidetes bacterium]|nr:4-hydroxy-tetrahydrodipicolinate synthase [Bacteroidota bacterium]
MINLNGCGTALITPFEKNLEVDFVAFRKLVRRQIAGGIHFLVPLGTTGETPCLEDKEKIHLLEITLEEAGKRIPVIAGAGSNSTKHVISTMNTLGKTGVDAFLIVTPYYNKPTQEGMYNHFKAVAESTDKPIIMYNVPARTSVNMTAETCLRLAEIKNIAATKEASGNYAQISEIIRSAPEGFSVLSGNDDETLSLVSTGANGVISVASNIAPELMSDFMNKLLDGDIEEARKLHHKLTPLFKNCFVESNPIPVKAGMHKMGLIENTLRPPLYPSTDKTLEIMESTLKELNLL